MKWSAGLTPEGQQVPAITDPRCGTEEAPFEAVLVFTDPVDWYRDLQLLTDVIMSGIVKFACYTSSTSCLYNPTALCNSLLTG